MNEEDNNRKGTILEKVFNAAKSLALRNETINMDTVSAESGIDRYLASNYLSHMAQKRITSMVKKENGKYNYILLKGELPKHNKHYKKRKEAKEKIEKKAEIKKEKENVIVNYNIVIERIEHAVITNKMRKASFIKEGGIKEE